MSPRVLVVEDSLTVRMDLTEAFEAAGFRVAAAPTAAAARAALAAGGVDLAVLDVLLPDGDGTALLAEIRAAPGGGPRVMMLSTEAEVRDRVRGLAVGADEYAGKPYDRNWVVSRARELLRDAGTLRGAADGGKLVLVIDDSPTFAEELGRTLAAAGYRTARASSGEEGLRAAADLAPAAVVVDGVLPGIDGATVVRRMRLDTALRSVPCLLLTASEGPGAELKALDAGADDFARKEMGLELILARVEAMLRRTGEPAAAGEPGASGPKRILAVDDSLTYREELAEALREEGYDVVTAASGAEALELLAVQPVDCVLLDLLMPGMDGRETCARLKRAPGLRDIPVVILTALDERESMLSGLGAGADDYLTKNGEMDILRARVRAQLRRRQFEDENRRFRDRLARMELGAAESRAAKQLAETRAGLVRELERRNRELEAFSYSVSHDLRAPLRAVNGFSRAVLEEEGGRLGERARERLERVCAAAEQMGELIEALLELSRMSRAQITRTRVDLSGLARSVAAGLDRLEPERRVAWAIAPGLEANGDYGLLRILLENLMGNAVKFTRKAAASAVEVGAREEGGERVFFVRDNGVGFDPSRAHRLFLPFQRLHSAEEFPGTGIGLATVQRIVERHAGRVWADAAPGRGACFSWTL